MVSMVCDYPGIVRLVFPLQGYPKGARCFGSRCVEHGNMFEWFDSSGTGGGRVQQRRESGVDTGVGWVWGPLVVVCHMKDGGAGLWETAG